VPALALAPQKVALLDRVVLEEVMAVPQMTAMTAEAITAAVLATGLAFGAPVMPPMLPVMAPRLQARCRDHGSDHRTQCDSSAAPNSSPFEQRHAILLAHHQ
jgi:hypothetical protein